MIFLILAIMQISICANLHGDGRYQPFTGYDIRKEPLPVYHGR